MKGQQHVETVKNNLRVVVSIALALVCFAPLVAASPLAPQGINHYCPREGFYFGQDLVLVCTPEGLFEATDEGWQMIFTWSRPAEVRATREVTIYLFEYPDDEGNRSLYRSVDRGKTWEFVGVPPSKESAYPIHIFPSPMPDVVFLGVSGHDTTVPNEGGIARSTDGGVTWEKVLEWADGEWVAFSPNFARDGTAFAALTAYRVSLGIWKTEDWGETWFPVHDGLYIGPSFYGYSWVAVSPQFPQDQTVFTSDWTGLYETTNGGESWLRVNDIKIFDLVFSPDYIHDQTLQGGGYPPDYSDNGVLSIYLSQDGGQSWQPIFEDDGIMAIGLRHPGPFGPLSPQMPPPGSRRFYLPLVSRNWANHGRTDLEFWVVTIGEGPGPGPYVLCRSRDYGDTWEEVSVDPQLAVAKRTAPAPVQGGAPFTYTIGVTNTGNVILHAAVTDTLPVHVAPGTTPSGSTLLPGGTLTWRPVVTPAGVWRETVVVAVEAGYVGPLTNVVQVTTVEGVSGVYTATVAMVEPQVYLPLVLRRTSPGAQSESERSSYSYYGRSSLALKYYLQVLLDPCYVHVYSQPVF